MGRWGGRGWTGGLKRPRRGIAWLIVLLSATVGLSTAALAQPVGTTTVRASIGAWQVLTQSRADTADRCLARAVHPAIADREVLWIVDPALIDRYPEGLLRISRAPGDAIDTSVTVAIDGAVVGALSVGFDGAYYSPPDLAGSLRDRLARGLELTVTAEPMGPDLTVSLTGSAAALSRAESFCEPGN